MQTIKRQIKPHQTHSVCKLRLETIFMRILLQKIREFQQSLNILHYIITFKSKIYVDRISSFIFSIQGTIS